MARNAFGVDSSGNVGDRIPHSDKVANDDPARSYILITLRRMELSGVEIDDKAVEIATKLGRRKYEEGQEEREGRDEHLRAGVLAVRDGWKVYYVRCGNLIKIGYTANLAQRFTTIRPNEVLALEPGGQEVETRRHRQFAQLRASGEYFHPGPALQSHIVGLRSTHGSPVWTSSLVPDGRNWFPMDEA
ncbi:GIY-YIG nuclease family protein [Streptomyces bullii]|uniref:GIY-YIG nuclease family protein n=1 Tax=Streptomyces bullii TaxID=349910 RepID=A0ABW0UP57_9ACTN